MHEYDYEYVHEYEYVCKVLTQELEITLFVYTKSGGNVKEMMEGT